MLDPSAFGAPAAPAPAASADDGFGGFGGAPASGGGDDFGDFGGFGDAPAAAPTGGGFGDFGGSSSMANLAADGDDSFSNFTAMSPPAVPGGGGGGGGGVSGGDEGGLSSTLARLLQEARFEEALQCKRHIEAIAQLAVKQQAYEAAKANDDLEVAIQIKKVELPRLREQLQPEAAVQLWQAASAGASVGAMVEKARTIFGEAEAAPFAASCSRDLGALAASDLPAAAAEHGRVRAALELLLELPPAEQARHLAQMARLVQEATAQLKRGASALEALPSGIAAADRARLCKAERVVELRQSLLELRRVALLLAGSHAAHAAVFVASVGDAAKGVPPVAELHAELTDALRRGLAAVDAEDEQPEPPPAEQLQRYLQVARPMAQRCALSLLPLRCAPPSGPQAPRATGPTPHAARPKAPHAAGPKLFSRVLTA